VDPIAVLAIIAQESGGDPNATNLTGGDALRGGSYGLMQMSLATAKGYGYTGTGTGLLDPRTNVDLGVRYLADCFAQAGGDLNGAAQAYNSGRTTGAPSYGAQVVSFYNKLGGQYGSPESGQADGSPLSSESGVATVAVLILATVVLAGLAALSGALQ
jgi:soluble lytic murein transglycosylase-like protein